MSRLLAFRAIILIIVTVLVGRLYQLQLVNSKAREYTNTLAVNTTRWRTVAPIRGEILAADGVTRLAESVPIFTVSAAPANLPAVGSFERNLVFAQLSELLALSPTLTISPAIALNARPGLEPAITETLGPDILAALRSQPLTNPISVTLTPAQSIPAATLSYAYSDVVQLVTVPGERLEPATQGQLPSWQTVRIREDISRDMALVIWENASSLPGIFVEEDYKRRYPHASTIPSLSHILGYIGRIDTCELVNRNPAPTWNESLLGSLSAAAPCGLVTKKLVPGIEAPFYLNDDRIGKDGIEYLLENELRGQVGIQSLLVDALDRPVGPPQDYRRAHTGNNLILTIDLAFQQQVETLLRKWLAEADRRRRESSGQFEYRQNYEPITNGVAIVLDPRNGRVLASVSLPSYDNNIWVDPARQLELQNVLAPPPELVTETLRLAPLTNRAISGQYPPGSTFKQFVGSIALQQGVVSPDTLMHDPGSLVVQDRYVAERQFVYPNSVPGDRGNVTIVDALRYSSNVFFMSIAGGNNDQVINLQPEDWRTNGLGIRRMVEGLEWFGFGTETGLAPSIESLGRVPTPGWKQSVLREPWTTGDTYNASIGQGNLLVTPVQLINAASAIANGGTLYRPWMVQSITNAAGVEVRHMTPQVVRSIPIDPANLAVIRAGMRESVTDGPNVAARDECSGLSIAGKTGTAEFSKIIPETGQQRSHAWFVGFAPYQNPEIAVVVLIEGAGDLEDGSATLAVPAVTEMMQAYFHVAPPADRPLSCPVIPS